MEEEFEVLKQHAETVGLDAESQCTDDQRSELIESLREADEISLANYVKNLGNAKALQDFVTFTLYNG